MKKKIPIKKTVTNDEIAFTRRGGRSLFAAARAPARRTEHVAEAEDQEEEEEEEESKKKKKKTTGGDFFLHRASCFLFIERFRSSFFIFIFFS